MRQLLSPLQKVKTVIHIVQALSIFIATCVCIAAFVQQGHSDSRLKWFFALCWISVPALIYLTAVPMWTRAENIAKSLWFACVDGAFTVLWLSAFAAVIAWLRAGQLQGAADKKIDMSQANCTTFAYGTEKKCSLGYTVSGFGVFIFVLFIATTVISVLYTMKSRKDPQAQDPWLAPEDKQPYAPASDMERGSTPAKDPIWDTNTQELDGLEDDHDSYEEQQHNRRDHEDDEYSRLHNTETDDGLHPGRPWGPLGGNPSGGGGGHVQMPSVDTEYRGAANYQAPSALSPDGYSPARGVASPIDDYTGRPAPAGGYSFSQGDRH